MTALFSALSLPSIHEIFSKFEKPHFKGESTCLKGDEVRLERENVLDLMSRDPGAVSNEISLFILLNLTQR